MDTAAAPRDPPASPVALELVVSCEPAFGDAVRDLVSRAASLAGGSDAACASVAGTVATLFERLIAAGALHADLGMTVGIGAGQLDVDFVVTGVAPALSRAFDRVSSDAGLSSRLDGLEAGRIGGRRWCRVSQRLAADA